MNIILLSGGSGKRLWPLSNDVRSKQFIKLFKNEKGEYESMVQRVYRQITKVDPEAKVTIATSKSQASAIKNQLETRARYIAVDFLDGFSDGYLETDGYQGYNNLPGIRRCSCWAHTRRYFIDAVPKGKQYDYSNPAVQGVQFCLKLFDISFGASSK